MLSPVDIALIATVALVVFGSKRLPEVGKAVGQAIGNFKKGMDETTVEPKDGDGRKPDEDDTRP